MFTALATLFNPPRSRRKNRLAVHSAEGLESRQMMSWSAVPATFGWPASTTINFTSNDHVGTGAITNNEVDVYNFIAPRTGTYTISAGRNGGSIDTVLGVFNWAGNRLAGNDDISPTNRDSEVRVYLQAGFRYAMAITNYTNSSQGNYRWEIMGPSLSTNLVTNNWGGGTMSTGQASLVGNNLRVYLFGTNGSIASIADHRVSVYLLDGNGRPIHTGAWTVNVRTGGTLNFGVPTTAERTVNFNLSGWDLRAVRNIRIVVR